MFKLLIDQKLENSSWKELNKFWSEATDKLNNKGLFISSSVKFVSVTQKLFLIYLLV